MPFRGIMTTADTQACMAEAARLFSLHADLLSIYTANNDLLPIIRILTLLS